MMRRLLNLLAVVLLAACAKPEDDGARVLTYASPYPSTHPFSRADITWMKFVERESKGRVRIKPYWGGALLSSNDNMLELRHGVADIGMVTPMYARSAHLQRSQPSFYSGVATVPDQITIYRCLAERFPAMNGEVYGLRVLAVQGGNFPGILTRDRPVRTLADLKGLRLRAQEDTAEVLKELGADPVNMSMAEVYPSMAKGVIDGVIAPVDALKAVHLAEVGRYFSTLRISRGAYPGRAMSERTWQRLTPAQQDLLTRAEAVWEQALVRELDKALAAGLAYAHEKKIEFVDVPPEDQRRFDQLYTANALRLSKRLERFGIDGPAIAKGTAALVAERNAGRDLNCGGAR